MRLRRTFHPPAPGIVANNELHRAFLVIGDDEGRFFMTVSAHDDLAQHPLVVAQGDGLFINERIGEFALFVSNGDAFPGLDFLEIFDELMAPTPQRDEFDASLIEFGEVGVGGELRVEDKSWFDTAAHAFPKGKNGKHLIVGFLSLYVGGGVEHEFALGILSKQRQGTFISTSSQGYVVSSRMYQRPCYLSSRVSRRNWISRRFGRSA